MDYKRIFIALLGVLVLVLIFGFNLIKFILLLPLQIVKIGILLVIGVVLIIAILISRNYRKK